MSITNMAFFSTLISKGARSFMTIIVGVIIIAAVGSLIWIVGAIAVTGVRATTNIYIPYPDLVAFVSTMLTAVIDMILPFTVLMLGEAGVGIAYIIVLAGVAGMIIGALMQSGGGLTGNQRLIDAGKGTVSGFKGLTDQGYQLSDRILKSAVDLSQKIKRPP